MKVLHLSNCRYITSEGAKARFAELTSLKLERCDKLIDGDIEQIVENCPSLQFLDICGSNSLTDASLFAFAEHAALKEVRMNDGIQFSKFALESVKKKKKGLHLRFVPYFEPEQVE